MFALWRPLRDHFAPQLPLLTPLMVGRPAMGSPGNSIGCGRFEVLLCVEADMRDEDEDMLWWLHEVRCVSAALGYGSLGSRDPVSN